MSSIWALFAVVFLAIYTANLAAFMIPRKEYHDLSGLDDTKISNPYSQQPPLKYTTIPYSYSHVSRKVQLLLLLIRDLTILSYGMDSPFVSDSCQKMRENSNFLAITLILNISGQKWAIDKIPKPKIIYWEMATSLDSQNNSISCLNNSISCFTW